MMTGSEKDRGVVQSFAERRSGYRACAGRYHGQRPRVSPAKQVHVGVPIYRPCNNVRIALSFIAAALYSVCFKEWAEP